MSGRRDRVNASRAGDSPAVCHTLPSPSLSLTHTHTSAAHGTGGREPPEGSRDGCSAVFEGGGSKCGGEKAAAVCKVSHGHCAIPSLGPRPKPTTARIA